MSDTGLDQVRNAIDTAPALEPLPAEEKPAGKETPKVDPRDADRITRMKNPIVALKDDCPVRPLGVMGDVCYYLDPMRQLRTLAGDKHTRTSIMSLFGTRIDYLHTAFVRWGKDGPDGWRPEQAAESLIVSASNKGVWDAAARVRGAGAWEGEDGELILHCGDMIWQSPIERGALGKWHEPGLISRHVYPASAKLPRPDDKAAEGGEDGAGMEARKVLMTWNWRQGEVDAHLMLGWIACAMLGGALKWRPLAWTTGGKGTGKSTLHELLQGLFGDGIVTAADATAAGIWQKVGFATIPIAIDEMEAEEDNRRANNVIKLARLAASGALLLRGGADHQGTQFQARSCFLFSSILVPPLTGQDRSRMAILELGEIDSKAAKPWPDEPDYLQKLGARLRRRLVDGWYRWKETYKVYETEMETAGYSKRSIQQFANLLTGADVFINDTIPQPEDARNWIEQLQISRAQEEAENEREEQRCLNHLKTFVIDAYRGGTRSSIAHWIVQAAGKSSIQDSVDPKEANKILQTYGLRVVRGKKTNGQFLAIANQHVGLAQIFQNTHWRGLANTSGVWVQALRSLPGAEVAKQPVSFASHISRCTLVPIETILSGAGPDTNEAEPIEGV